MSDTTSTANLVLDKPKSRDDWIKAPEWALIPKEELSIKLEVRIISATKTLKINWLLSQNYSKLIF